MKSNETNEDFVSHAGVKGMHWGVWNEETRRKRMGGTRHRTVKNAGSNVGRKLGPYASRAARLAGNVGRGVGKAASVAGKGTAKLAKKVGTAAAQKTKAAVKDFYNAQMEKRQQRKTTNELMDAQGIDSKRKREAFEKLRKQTLRSHDPAVVEKGVHTLTDSELSAKIKRLEAEQKVKGIAKKERDDRADSMKRLEEARKAKKERRNSGFMAMTLRSVITSQANNAGKKLIDKYIGGSSNDQGSKKNKKDKETNNTASNDTKFSVFKNPSSGSNDNSLNATKKDDKNIKHSALEPDKHGSKTPLPKNYGYKIVPSQRR